MGGCNVAIYRIKYWRINVEELIKHRFEYYVRLTSNI